MIPNLKTTSMFQFVNKSYRIPVSLIKQIKADIHIHNLIKNLPKDYKFIFLSECPEYTKVLKKLCFSISQSKDLNHLNYSKKRFPINKQIDILLLTSGEKILAFSSLWQSPYYPKNCVRVLNRSWKDPSIRRLVSKKIMLIFLLYQIKLAIKNKKIDLIFSSMEGIRTNWWKRWSDEVNKLYSGWKIYPKMIKVCNGPYKKCWQSCAYLNLFNNNPILLFPSLKYKEWKELVKKEAI